MNHEPVVMGNQTTLCSGRRLVWLRALGLAIFISFTPAVAKEGLPSKTALDDYIAKPDNSYSWKIVKTLPHPGGKTFVIDMISQTWRTSEEVDRPQWQHWLLVTVPDNVKSEIGFLMIGGGRNGGDPPGKPDDIVLKIAKTTGTVVAELKMIPNQPLVFHQDGQKRVEDDLIGYTWDQFLKTGDATWPARNPMVKSAVRAMDTITALIKSLDQEASSGEDGKVVDKFVVAGGSKRGWTTWLTGAVDDRVVAIIPIVIDVLNTRASMLHHHAAYGFWAPSVGDYVAHRIMERMDDPRTAELYKLVDPYSYRHRLTMPKFLVNGSGDQFFLPDSSRFYFDKLQGEKHLRYVPNADHGLGGSDAVESIAAFYWMIVNGKRRPEFTWEFEEDGSIRVQTVEQPKQVKLWQATNPNARDFRIESLGPKYTSTSLEDQGDGVYVARLSAPKKGWTAAFVELTYDVGAPVPIKFTTSVRILPDVLPYADKDGTQPGTILLRCNAPDEAAAETIKREASSYFQTAPVPGRTPPWTGGKQANNKTSGDHGAHGDARAWGRVERHGRHLELHWQPRGRMRASALGMTAWLKKQGCNEFDYRLEAGF